MDSSNKQADGDQRPSKKFKIESAQHRALQALAKGENGAEWHMFDVLEDAVVSGKTIEPVFQTVVNVIVAKAFLLGKLPAKRKGRPKDAEGIMLGECVASRYYFLVDAGASYKEAVAQVAREFCKDERHIMRLVSEYKHRVGETVETRQQTRRWRQMSSEVLEEAKAEGRLTYLDQLYEAVSMDKPDDRIEELEKLIQHSLSHIKSELT
jgi:hypothetical protein